jgi:hypothetical protein
MADVRNHVAELKTPASVALFLAQEFQSHPIAVTKLFLMKIARSWYGTDSGRREFPILLIQLVYLVPVSWGAWKTWKLGNRYRDFALIALLIVFYFWGMTFLAISILRYMVPIIGLLAILMAGCFKHSDGRSMNQLGR